MLNSENILQKAIQIIDIETEAIQGLKKNLNADFFKAIEVIHQSQNRLIVTGIGKSALIAQKIVATFNSTGTPAIFMHAADAVHGDLGIVQQGDVVIIISQSGETPEIKVLVPLIRQFGNPIIAITGNKSSYLAKQAMSVLWTEVTQEACPHNLAPTSSTTAQLVIGDALAVCLLTLKGFTDQDFAKYHPGGMLGKRLYLKVQDLCDTSLNPVVQAHESISEVIFKITSNRLGVVVVQNKDEIVGVITDGDIRRMLQNHKTLEHLLAKDIMSVNPKKVEKDTLVANCVDIFKQHKISQLMVLNQGRFYGFIHVHDLLREGML